MKKIEELEFFGRMKVSEPVSIVFGQALSGSNDEVEMVRASNLMQDVTEGFERRLEKTPWLVGENMTAADVTAAPYVFYSMLPPEAAKASPIAQAFLENLHLGEDRDRTRDWVRRVMAYDS